MNAVEVNFDGLVGPTHNYGGLAQGNLAAAANEGSVSNPREAALQGLSKMRALVRMGLTQGVLPPHERPHVTSLRKMGFGGNDADVIRGASRASPLLLANVSSASAMWTANAATAHLQLIRVMALYISRRPIFRPISIAQSKLKPHRAFFQPFLRMLRNSL